MQFSFFSFIGSLRERVVEAFILFRRKLDMYLRVNTSRLILAAPLLSAAIRCKKQAAAVFEIVMKSHCR